MRKISQKGFASVETALVVIILIILSGTGWYVWHSKQAADKTLNDAGKSQPATQQAGKVTSFAACKSATGSKIQETFPEKCITKDGRIFTDTSPVNEQKYFTIKEWGVRAPYTDSLTLSYQLDTNGNAYFSAKQMDDLVADTNVSCTDFAGAITRYGATQVIDDGSDTTAAKAAQTNSSYIHVRNYYYLFTHSQALCSGTLPATLSKDKQDELAALLSQANNDVKNITAHLQASP